MMNERLEDLMYLSGMTAQGCWDSMDDFQRQAVEKFAELIVQECTQLLFTESERLYAYSSECDNMRDSDEAELCAEKCMDNITMIEEHFGVEDES